MGFGLFSDDVIQEILARAMEKQFSKARPAARHFFDHSPQTHEPPHVVAIHRWALAEVNESDSLRVVQMVADRVVKEVVTTATEIMSEIVFRAPRLLPQVPLWTDGLPLFSTAPEGRFGVETGNVLQSANCFGEDLLSAVHILQLMDPEFDPQGERLLVFCAKPLEKRLIRAAAKVQVPCRVFGLLDYKDERSWVLTRDTSPCSMIIGKPDFSLPVKGNKIVAGAKFTVWVEDPRNAVCVTP